jgi:hypothetical protein
MTGTRVLVFAFAAAMVAGCAGGGTSSVTPALGQSGAPRQTASVDSAATKLKCFSGTTDKSGYGGTCTLTPTGAILNTAANGGGYAGVYISSTNNMKSRPLTQVEALQFNFTGDPATAGSPRFSVAYTTDGGATTNYAYISAFYCNNAGLVDALHNTVCTIFTSVSPFVSYPNWAAFVAANPGATLNGIPFVVADDPGHTWTVSNVQISK